MDALARMFQDIAAAFARLASTIAQAFKQIARYFRPLMKTWRISQSSPQPLAVNGYELHRRYRARVRRSR